MAVAEKRKRPQAQAQIPLQEGMLGSTFGKDDMYEGVKQHTWRWVSDTVFEEGNVD